MIWHVRIAIHERCIARDGRIFLGDSFWVSSERERTAATGATSGSIHEKDRWLIAMDRSLDFEGLK